MNTSHHRETAKIYQFPTDRRAAAVSGRTQKQTPEALSPVRPAPAKPAMIAYGASWYHEAAIQESDESSQQ